MARLAKVDMDVDEPRRDHPAAGVDRLDARRRREPRPNPDDATGLDEHVPRRVEAVGGIDDPTVPDQEVHRARPPRPWRRSGGTGSPSVPRHRWPPGRG